MSAVPTAAAPSQVPASFFAMHEALRADVARLAGVADRMAAGNGAAVPALVDGITLFIDMLQLHNGLEDDFVVPEVLARRADAGAVVGVLEAQHAQLDTLAYRVRDRAAVLDPDEPRWRSVAATVAEDLSALADAVAVHLDDEERDLVPRWCEAFTQDEQDALSVAVQDRIGERLPLVMGWLAHVLGEAAVLALVAAPGPEDPRLPRTWQAAFTERPAATL